MRAGWLEDPAVERAGRDTVRGVPRGFWWLASGLLALHATLIWLNRAPGLLTRQDDARYLFLARSLAQGSYRDILWVDAPVHHLYPPGYPLLLMFWRAIGGERFDWLVGLQIVLSTVSLALIFDAARRRLPPAVAVLGLALAAVNVSLVEWSAQVASEPALMMCTALAIWASAALPAGRAGVLLLLLAGCAAPAMRSAGIVVPIAVVLSLAVERRWRAASLASLVFVPVVGGMLWWTLNDPSPVVGSSYAADLTAPVSDSAGIVGSVLARVRVNFEYYLTRGLPTMLPLPTVEGTVVDNAVGVLGVVTCLTTGLYVALRRMRMLLWTVLGTFGLLAVWVWQVGRFLVPVLPFVLLLLVIGAWRVGRHRSARTALMLSTALVVIIGATSLSRLLPRIAERLPCDRSGDFPSSACVEVDQAGFFAAARFVRDSLPRSARLLSAKSEPLAVYTGHVTQPYQRLAALSADSLRSTLLQQGVEYVLLSKLQIGESVGLSPLLEARCAHLELVRFFPPRTLLLRWRSQSDPGAEVQTGVGGAACQAIRRYRADPEVPRVSE